MEQRSPITHELKCHPGPFQAVKDGAKPFEWCRDDRDYRVGDTLRLREWMPGTGWDNDGGDEGDYSGEEAYCTVTYIISKGFYIPEGYCIMGLSKPEAKDGLVATAPDAAQVSVASGQAANGWISVEERLPEDGLWVITFSAGITDDFQWDISYFDVSGKWKCLDSDYPVTHWQPLPTPPTK